MLQSETMNCAAQQHAQDSWLLKSISLILFPWNKFGMIHVSSTRFMIILRHCENVQKVANAKTDSISTQMLQWHWLLSVSFFQYISHGSACSFSAPPWPLVTRTTSFPWPTLPRAPPGPRSRHRGRTLVSCVPSQCSQTPRGICQAVLKQEKSKHKIYSVWENNRVSVDP